MADTELNISINADTSGALGGISAINNALGYMAIKTSSTQQPVQELFGALQKSSDSAVAGIIKGTETWQKALLNVAQGVEIKFAQLMVNLLINWVETELGMTTASQTQSATRTASAQAAATAAGAARVAQASSALQSDAALAYGGVYAFLAPEVGPAASGPAAASEAQVMSQMSLIHLDVGAWDVPQNMPAFLHAGEMVVPANFASGLRSGAGLGGGGDSYTININAVDTQTGAQFLKNNAAVIAQTLSSQVRNFNKNLPAWKS